MSVNLIDKSTNTFPTRRGVAQGDFINSAEMNGYLGDLGERTNYLYTMGIYPHSASFDYPAGAFCQVSGAVYRAIAANTGKPPASNPSIWAACPMTAAEISAALNFVTALNGKQDADNTLTALANLATSADKMIYATGADQFALTPLTAFIRTLLDDGDADAARVTLGAAPLVSPALTDTPTAPTPATGTRTTQLATTAFVGAEIAADRPFEATAANIKMDGTQAVGTLNTVARGDHVHPTDTSRAPLASPALTGTPTVPTAVVGANTAQIANMAAVRNEFAARKFVSGDFLLSRGGLSIINHTLGAIPANTCLFARCVLANGGFAIGDVIALGQIVTDTDVANTWWGFTSKLTTAAVSVKVANGGLWVIGDNGNYHNIFAVANAWNFFIVATL